MSYERRNKDRISYVVTIQRDKLQVEYDRIRLVLERSDLILVYELIRHMNRVIGELKQ